MAGSRHESWKQLPDTPLPPASPPPPPRAAQGRVRRRQWASPAGPHPLPAPCQRRCLQEGRRRAGGGSSVGLAARQRCPALNASSAQAGSLTHVLPRRRLPLPLQPQVQVAGRPARLVAELHLVLRIQRDGWGVVGRRAGRRAGLCQQPASAQRLIAAGAAVRVAEQRLLCLSIRPRSLSLPGSPQTCRRRRADRSASCCRRPPGCLRRSARGS